jgi:hypothetical protein
MGLQLSRCRSRQVHAWQGALKLASPHCDRRSAPHSTAATSHRVAAFLLRRSTSNPARLLVWISVRPKEHSGAHPMSQEPMKPAQGSPPRGAPQPLAFRHLPHHGDALNSPVWSPLLWMTFSWSTAVSARSSLRPACRKPQTRPWPKLAPRLCGLAWRNVGRVWLPSVPP